MLGVVLLGEAPTAMHLAGVALVLSALVLSVTRTPASRSRTAAA